MNYQRQHFLRNITLLMLLGNVLGFTFFYLQTFVITGAASFYILHFLTKTLETALLVFGATVLFCGVAAFGGKYMLPRLPLFLLPRFLYSLPNDYLSFLSYGYDSLESVVLGLLLSVAQLLVYALLLLLFATLGMFLSHAATKKSKIPFSLRDGDGGEDIFDFSRASNLALLGIAGGVFLYNLISEIVNTVSYLMDYAGSYTVGEIVYMLFTYLFLLALAVGGYLLAVLVRGRFLRRGKTEK